MSRQTRAARGKPPTVGLQLSESELTCRTVDGKVYVVNRICTLTLSPLV
jgi:hypothetical protein